MLLQGDPYVPGFQFLYFYSLQFLQTAFLADMAESDPRLARFTYFPFGLLSPGGGKAFRRVLCTQLT